MRNFFFTLLSCWCLLVSANPDTNENKLLVLRQQMGQATSLQDRLDILQEAARTDIFQALKFVETYQQDPALGKKAARLAKKMTKQHPEWKGFVSLFNGKDLTGWKGLVENPIRRAQMTAAELTEAQAKADEVMRRDWKVVDGKIAYVGHGFENLCTERSYRNFELYIDWQLDPNGNEPDAGIYLRGTPQVQIWDIARVNVGAQVGSGGLYNNQQHRSTPLCVADNTLGEWNSFRIRMVDDRVSVWLNGVLVVDEVVMENYWDRSLPIPACDQIELQAHGSLVYFRDIYLKEL
ncbi:MAG: DUF1080 domain-containing protein [Bacteroidaceae bacterium]|nr:DUF1080 domain-containing protein [Bacteroidaceae bacterium]